MVDLAELKMLLELAGDTRDTAIGRAFTVEKMENALVIAAPALIAELEAARECVEKARKASDKFIRKYDAGRIASIETIADMRELFDCVADYDAATKSGGGNADR